MPWTGFHPSATTTKNHAHETENHHRIHPRRGPCCGADLQKMTAKQFKRRHRVENAVEIGIKLLTVAIVVLAVCVLSKV